MCAVGSAMMLHPRSHRGKHRHTHARAQQSVSVLYLPPHPLYKAKRATVAPEGVNKLNIVHPDTINRGGRNLSHVPAASPPPGHAHDAHPDMTDGERRMNERCTAKAHVWAGGEGGSFRDVFKDMDKVPLHHHHPPTPLSMRMILRFHYYGTLQLTLNRRTAVRCCHSGAGPYGEPIHAPKPRSAANRVAAEADLWLHSHTWFHYALVKRLRLLRTRRCGCSVCSGEDADGSTGEGRDEEGGHEESNQDMRRGFR